jgi:hypothetical protein
MYLNQQYEMGLRRNFEPLRSASMQSLPEKCFLSVVYVHENIIRVNWRNPYTN